MINPPSTFTVLLLGLSFNNPEKIAKTIRISPINMICFSIGCILTNKPNKAIEVIELGVFSYSI